MHTEQFNIDAISKEIAEEFNSQRTRKKSLSYYKGIVKQYYDVTFDELKRGLVIVKPEQLASGLLPFSKDRVRNKFNTRYTDLNNAKKYWLDYLEKQYPLYTIIKIGNNQENKGKGTYTMVKPNIEIEVLLASTDPTDLVRHFYGDLPEDTIFDDVPIDLRSLNNYIKANQAITKRYDKLDRNLHYAQLIYKIASCLDGVLPQIVNESEFGRKYYNGINLQSAPKIVRHAALGDCVSYDISASVFSWKFWAAKQLDPTIKLPATIEYLDLKSTQRKRLSFVVFGNYEEHSIKRIKQAFSAIGFGARAQNGVWYADGERKTNALNAALGHKERVDLFLKDAWVKEFTDEQKAINALLFNWFKKNNKKSDYEMLLNKNGAFNEAKTIAFMYQQAERELIEAAMQAAEEDEILLLVHDGFYTRRSAKKLEVKEVVGNFYYVEGYTAPAIDREEITGYVFVEQSDIINHKQHIINEGRFAEEYASSQGRTTSSVTQDQILYREKARQEYIKEHKFRKISNDVFIGFYNEESAHQYYLENQED